MGFGHFTGKLNMRIAYLDCSSGISGDMTVAALVEAGVDFAAIRAGIESLGLPQVRVETRQVIRCGFRATHLSIDHPEQHAHRHLAEICQIIDGARALAPAQKELARRIFTAIAEAEAKVHGSTLDQVHFHEVGAIDSIVDIVAAAIGFDLLGVEQVIASPVPTGRGRVTIAHGVCTVPTPGTAELLKGIPLADVPIDAELTTPTGAAILRAVVSRFGPLPPMTIESIGYGAGTKDFPNRANVLRILVGHAAAGQSSDEVWLLETNLDDVPGEIIGYARQKLLAAGALDVFTVPIQMKKGRPGVLLSVIAKLGDRERLESIVFAETATFGIRRRLVERSKRDRQACEVETAWGAIRGKLGKLGEQVVFTPEYESCAAAAARFNVPLRDVYRDAESAFARRPVAFTGSATSSQSPPAESRSHDHDHGHEHI